MSVEFGTTDLPEEDVGVALERLAHMASLAYEQCRKAEAEKLGLRAGVLDREVDRKRRDLGLAAAAESKRLTNVRPATAASVNGAVLLDDVVATIRRHCVLPKFGPEAVALWAAHTYSVDSAFHTPRLAVISAEKGSGKTTLLDIVGELSEAPLPVANVTSAALFRIVESERPTLLVDEADTFLRDAPELRGILNAGHRRDGQVIRCEGEDNEVKKFSVFAPVAIASIGKLPETLMDRSIVLRLQRAKKSEPLVRLRMDRSEVFPDLRGRLARLALDMRLANADPVMPDELFNRAADNWRFLIAIADAAGGHWPATARRAAVALSALRDAESDLTMLLSDTREMLTSSNKIKSATLVQELWQIEDRPWPEYSHGRAISTAQVAKLLSEVGIAPKLIRFHDGPARGYERARFEDAFERYLPPKGATPVTSLQNPEVRRFEGASPITSDFGVTDQVTDDGSKKPQKSAVCNDVTGVMPPDPFDLNNYATGTYGVGQ